MNPGQPRYQPKYAVVTGAARRLGRAIALGLARDGWSIVLGYLSSQAEAEQTAAEVRALGVQCVICQADMSQPDDVDKLMRCAIESGPVRCLVNNASLFEFDCAKSIEPVSFNQHMTTNLLAPLLLTRKLYEHIPEGEQGVVVNLLDQKLDNLNPDFLSYTLAKAGLNTATRMLATELAPRLRVVGVSPGLTLISHLQTQAEFEQAHQISPINRSSQPEDIVNAVCFLVQSPAITGTTLLVDGGQHLVPMARDFSMMNS